MSVFDPNCTHNAYGIGYELTGQPGNQYRFSLAFNIDDAHLTITRDENAGRTEIVIDGMSMGDIVEFRRNVGLAIKEARQEKKELDDAC